MTRRVLNFQVGGWRAGARARAWAQGRGKWCAARPPPSRPLPTPPRDQGHAVPAYLAQQFAEMERAAALGEAAGGAAAERGEGGGEARGAEAAAAGKR